MTRRKHFPAELKKALLYNVRVEYRDPYESDQWCLGIVTSPVHSYGDGGFSTTGERVRILGDNGMQIYGHPNSVRLPLERVMVDYNLLRKHLEDVHRNGAAPWIDDATAIDQHWHEHNGPGGLRLHGHAIEVEPLEPIIWEVQIVVTRRVVAATIHEAIRDVQKDLQGDRESRLDVTNVSASRA